MANVEDQSKIIKTTEPNNVAINKQDNNKAIEANADNTKVSDTKDNLLIRSQAKAPSVGIIKNISSVVPTVSTITTSAAARATAATAATAIATAHSISTGALTSKPPLTLTVTVAATTTDTIVTTSVGTVPNTTNSIPKSLSSLTTAPIVVKTTANTTLTDTDTIDSINQIRSTSTLSASTLENSPSFICSAADLIIGDKLIDIPNTITSNLNNGKESKITQKNISYYSDLTSSVRSASKSSSESTIFGSMFSEVFESNVGTELESGALEDSNSSLIEGGIDKNCKICNSRLQSPRVLSCLHVFCEACLAKLLVPDESPSTSSAVLSTTSSLTGESTQTPPSKSIIECPLCKQITHVGPRGVKSITCDYILTNILDLTTIGSEQLFCTSCKSKENAISRCNDCASFLCGGCDKAHRFMRCFENHEVLKLEDLQKSSLDNGKPLIIHKPLYCSLHLSENLKYYCFNCQTPVCNDCLITDHKGNDHHYELIATAEKSVRGDVENLLKEAKTKVQYCDDAAANLSTALTELQTQHDSAHDLIQDTYEKCRKVLEKCRDQSLADLKKLHSERELKIMDLMQNIENTMGKIDNTCRFTKRVLEQANAAEFLAMKKLIANQFIYLINTTPKCDISYSLTFDTKLDKYEQTTQEAFGKFRTESTPPSPKESTPPPTLPGMPPKAINGGRPAGVNALNNCPVQVVNSVTVSSPNSLPNSMQNSFDGEMSVLVNGFLFPAPNESNQNGGNNGINNCNNTKGNGTVNVNGIIGNGNNNTNNNTNNKLGNTNNNTTENAHMSVNAGGNANCNVNVIGNSNGIANGNGAGLGNSNMNGNGNQHINHHQHQNQIHQQQQHQLQQQINTATSHGGMNYQNTMGTIGSTVGGNTLNNLLNGSTVNLNGPLSGNQMMGNAGLNGASSLMAGVQNLGNLGTAPVSSNTNVLNNALNSTLNNGLDVGRNGVVLGSSLSCGLNGTVNNGPAAPGGFSSMLEYNLSQLASLTETTPDVLNELNDQTVMSNAVSNTQTQPIILADLLNGDQRAFNNLQALAKLGLNNDFHADITNNQLIPSGPSPTGMDCLLPDYCLSTAASPNLPALPGLNGPGANNGMGGAGGVGGIVSNNGGGVNVGNNNVDITNYHPSAISAHAGTNILTGRSKATPMQIRSKFGSLGTSRGHFNSPHGFCLGVNEEIIVADTNNHRIEVFDKSGNLGFYFGVPGKEEGQLWYPRKVAVMPTNGKFVVCDRGNERSRMQIFSKNGHFMRKIAIRYIDIVAGLAVTSKGHIVAVDSVSPTVFVISEDGELVRWFDCSDYMREPSDIAIRDNDFYVCDFKGHCVAVFHEDGTFQYRIGNEKVTCFPNGIDISNAGDILIGDSHGNRFHVACYSRDGILQSEFECPHVKVSRCCGLKITSEGYVVTLAKNNHHVLVLNTLYVQ